MSTAKSQLKASTVTVASRLPMSIEIQLCQPKSARVTGQFGSVEETVNVKVGPVYVIRGAGYPNGQTPKGFPKRPQTAGREEAYALTPGVAADFWAEWLKQNEQSDIVRNGMIFAHAQPASLDKMADEREGVRTGLEPVDPDKDPRAPKPLNVLVQPVTTEEGRRDAA